MSAVLLVAALRDSGTAAAFAAEEWAGMIAAARAERLIGTLACRLDGSALPPVVERLLADARASAEEGRRAALWEVEMARRALREVCPVVLLKGSAFVAAGLSAGVGRAIGDLDILVPREKLDAAEAALLVAGWEWVKPDPYDDDYYRRWMHELPPLIHRARDAMIDVHHTIVPLTARITPDAGALLAGAEVLRDGVAVLSREDMICHAAAHLFADGDLAGGLRNLWDVRCLVDDGVPEGLEMRAQLHGLEREVARALRLAECLYSPVCHELVEGGVPSGLPASRALTSSARTGVGDRFYLRRLLARDGWGRQTRPLTRFAFYVRSHWLRMPLLQLARHLWIKWRKGGPGPG